MNNHRHSRLFRLAIKLLVIFGLFVFGLAIACLLAIVCGGLDIISILFSSVWVWLARVAVVVVCVLLVSIVGESLK